MVESPMFDVFLCHNSQDKPEVIEIARQLQQRGLKPWLDIWHLQPGLPWQRELEKQIKNIRASAVFVGSSGFGPWQEMEIEAYLRRFVKQGSPVIPVLLRNAPQQPELPIFLEGMTWVNFKSEYSDPMKQLIWGITGDKMIDESEQPLGLRHEGYRQPNSYPPQAGILSKEKARRRVLLGSTTVLGGVAISSAFFLNIVPLLFIGNSIILFMCMGIWLNCRAPRKSSWISFIVKSSYWGSFCVVFIFEFLFSVSIFWLEIRMGMGFWEGGEMVGLIWVCSLIIYLISTYIGRW